MLGRLVRSNLVVGVPVPSPHPVGLGLHTVLFPEIYLLHGCGRYQVMSYHSVKAINKANKMSGVDF